MKYVASQAQTSAAACSADIWPPPRRLLALSCARVLNHSSHPLQVLLADVALGENLTYDLARISPKEVAYDAGDCLAAHVELADPCPVNEGTPRRAMGDNSLLLEAGEKGADGSYRQWPRPFRRQLDFSCRRFALVPEDANDRQLEVAEVGARRHGLKLQLSFKGRQYTSCFVALTRLSQADLPAGGGAGSCHLNLLELGPPGPPKNRESSMRAPRL